MLTIKKVTNRVILKRVFNITLLSILLMGMICFTFVPEVIKANAGPVSVTASLSVTNEIDITAPGNFSLTPSIPGVTGNLGSPSSASAAFTVITNSAGGFDMKIYASQADALYLGVPADQYFDDYAPVVVGTPDYGWQSPGSNAAWFGYSVAAGNSGTDADQEFKYTGSTCNASGGTNSSDHCFFGMTTTPGTRIVHRTTYTSSSGETETVKFLAESNQKYLKQGTYQATITATVSMN